MANVSSQIRHE